MAHADLMEALRAIVSKEPPWKEDDLSEWAEEFLMGYEPDDDGEQDRWWEEAKRRQDHEHNGYCCRKEPWNVTLRTLTEALKPVTPIVIVNLIGE
jgi:hypothetical protein